MSETNTNNQQKLKNSCATGKISFVLRHDQLVCFLLNISLDVRFLLVKDFWY